MKHPVTSIAVLIVAFSVAGCTVEEQEEPDVSVARGKQLFGDKCAACHGDDGRGAGAASLGLGGPPPDLTTLSAQNRGLFPRNFVMSVIDGFNRRNHPDSLMPEFGNEDLGPQVQVEDGGASTPIPSDLIALASYLESIQR